jgi:transposase
MGREQTRGKWAVIDPLIPKKQSKRGRLRNGERQMLNGILYVLKTWCINRILK